MFFYFHFGSISCLINQPITIKEKKSPKLLLLIYLLTFPVTLCSVVFVSSNKEIGFLPLRRHFLTYFLWINVLLNLNLIIYPLVCPYIYLLVCPYIYLLVCPYIYLLVCPYIYLLVCLYIYLLVCPYIYLVVRLYIYLLVCPYVLFFKNVM